MKIEIEVYRGWIIFFDTEKEIFNCHSDGYDKEENKKTFSSVRKFIDDFLKENETFTPIWVRSKPSIFIADKKIRIIGIRKDGKFVYENNKGEKEQLSEHNEKDYILYDKNNDKYYEEANNIEAEIEQLRIRIKSIYAKVAATELTEYKKELLTNKN